MANELDLVEKAKKGNDEAFAALVSRYEAYVYNLAYRLLNDPALADDASQEAFIRAWKGLPSCRGEARFSTWMYWITYRACMDILGRRQDRLVLEVPAEAVDQGPGPPEVVEAREEAKRVWEAVAALPDKYRSVLVLFYLNRLSYAEIAHVLDGATSREKWTPGKLVKFAGTWKNALPAPGRRGSAGR